MTRAKHILFEMLPGILFAGAIMIVSDTALAQTTVRDMTANVGTNVRVGSNIVPLLCYVIGVFFAASGLLKLKDWINEGDKIGIMPALMRLTVSCLMIFMPHILVVATNTLFGSGTSETGVDVEISAPRLGAFERSK